MQWHDEHSAEREAPSFPDNLRGPWSKLTSACARLALIVHTIRHAMRDAEDEHVDELSMAMAACMVDQYFKPHTRRVYGHLTASPEGKRALAVVAWMRKQKMRQVSARDVMNAAQGGVRTKKDAEALFNDLVEMGFGTVSESKTPRGTRLMFTLSDQSEGTRG